jgi:N-acetylmuramoyl-L-alanine amidase
VDWWGVGDSENFIILYSTDQQKKMINKMKQLWLSLLLSVYFVSANSIHAEIKIEVIYPKEGSQVVAAESTFIFGNVLPVEVDFSVNNITIHVYPNGAFLAFVPVEPGNFSFVCRAVANGDTARVVRNVYIPYYLKTSPQDRLIIDTSYVFPKEDWVLQPGEIFKVAFKGTPNCEATFSIEGLAQDFPMTEIPAKKSFYWGEAIFDQGTNSQMRDVKGIYIGSYIIQNWDWAAGREVSFKLRDKAGNVKETVAPGKFNIDNSAIPKIGELTEELAVAWTGSGLGGKLFLPQGVKIWVTGQRGNYLRVKLSETEVVWISGENVKIAPSHSPLPNSVIKIIQTEGFEKKARVKISLDQRLPFKIEQLVKHPALLVTLYRVTANTDWIKLEFDEPLIREINWELKATNVYQLKIDLNQGHHWGYNPFFDDDGLYIDIKKKPTIHGWPFSPLKDIAICLDPGHSPDLGAIGPKGFIEKNLNYSYCVALKKKLEDKGAFVVLTRGENYGATIKVRAQLATFIEADILLSLHFNALSDGVNPFINHGISTYYYHPQSYDLAYLIQKMLLKETKVKNFGLFYENLAIIRPPQMIAVLTEPGFIMHPWEEILIASEAYKEKVIDAIVKAMEQFLKESN